MNNEQFRNLLLANAAKSAGQKEDGSSPARGGGGGTPVSALGSRRTASVPMTPRSVIGRVDFSRQLSERDRDGKPKNKFRTSAPRGSKLAEGYVDRAKAREAQEKEEETERAGRLEALKKSLDDGEIDRETYDKLQMQIAGGDLASTHLVKGLDYKLLQRIRKGEDVYGDDAEKQKSPEERSDSDSEPEEDADILLDELGAHDIKPVEKEKVKKKGQFAPASLVPGQKRTRDQILAEMKAAREAAKAKEQSALGSRFKKIGARQTPGSRIERDSKGREVMIIIDEDGNERRKVRKTNPTAVVASEKERDMFKPDKKAEVLGMEVPEVYRKQQLAKEKEEEEKEFSIFDDAGSDYDPLAGLDDDGDESEDEEGEEKDEGESKREPPADGEASGLPDGEAPGASPQKSSAPRNYFKDSKTAPPSAAPTGFPSISDPTLLAALKKARSLDAKAKSEEEIKAAEREERLKKMLQASSRDDEDLDIGFGTNRLEDEAELEDSKVKLSTWNGTGGDDEGSGGGKAKRKRGPKKRRGDKDSVADVMRVMESRKTSG